MRLTGNAYPYTNLARFKRGKVCLQVSMQSVQLQLVVALHAGTLGVATGRLNTTSRSLCLGQSDSVGMLGGFSRRVPGESFVFIFL
jgi:hypothetical protein